MEQSLEHSLEQSYEIKEAPPDDEVPGVEYELERAKLYLQKHNPCAGDNLYDHLCEVLSKILSEQPADVFGAFKEHSKKLMENKFKSKNDCLRKVYVSPSEYGNAVKLMELYKANLNLEDELEGGEEDVESVDDQVYPNLFDDMFYFEQCGVGLPRLATVRLNLSVRKLIARTKIVNVRFWGKILGRKKNYYVLEANLPDWELERRLMGDDGEEGEGDFGGSEREILNKTYDSELDVEGEGEEKEEIIEEEPGLKLVFPPMPENTWKPEPEVTSEKLGSGANAKVYLVCNSPGTQDWVELPDVTPQQIVTARQILHSFTGDLEAEIHSYPPFPGNEKNYLRAQIARISAGTLVSPIGFFSLSGDDVSGEGEEDEGEEEEEERGETGVLVRNRRYEPLSLKDLTDPSLSNWCHHSPAILKQGRVVWQDPTKTGTEGEDESGEGDEGEGEEESGNESTSEDSVNRGQRYEREIPPAMLAPLSEDVLPEPVQPWTARRSSEIQQDTAVACLRSNVWPGAFAYAYDKRFANIYMGWGHKHNAYNHNPAAMPPIEDQFVGESEIVEIQDPTYEEEEAYRIAHLPRSVDDEEGEEEDSSEEESDQE